MKNVEGILCVTGRKIEGVLKTIRLVPPGFSLYKQVTSWAHKKYHYFGPNYIKAQLQLQGYWVPQAIKRLKKLQDNCAHCKRHKKQVVLHTEMGSVPCSRLTSSFPFKEITSDICGPFVCRGFVDSIKTRKVKYFGEYLSLHQIYQSVIIGIYEF